MKRYLLLVLAFVLVLLSACHAVDNGASVTEPSTSITTDTEVTFPSMPIPTTPEHPAQIICESREDGLLYEPNVHHKNYSGKRNYMLIWFNLSEECYPGMRITYDVSANYGALELKFDAATSTLPLEYQTVYSWTGKWVDGDLDAILAMDGAIFVEAVIRADGHIVGFGIFEIGGDGTGWFALMRTETVIFPMVDGQLQNVTEEYVAEKLVELKQTVTPLDLEAKKAEYDAYLKEYWEQQKATEPTEG